MKNVTFYLGPAIGLSGRRLIITRLMQASDGLTRPAPYWSSNSSLLGADDTYVTVALPDNYIWEARLQDTKSTGEISVPDALHFHTGSILFPGPRSGDRLSIYSMEDESSSQSASSLSSSSSSSSTSSVTSSSSNSSSSSSSVSSQSSVTSSSSQSSVTSSSSQSSVTSSSSVVSSSSSSSLSSLSSSSSVTSSASSLSSSSSSSSSFHTPS